MLSIVVDRKTITKICVLWDIAVTSKLMKPMMSSGDGDDDDVDND